MLGLALIPLQTVCLGVYGLVMIVPLFGLLAYLKARLRWVWLTSIVFFLVEAFLLGVIGVLALRFFFDIHNDVLPLVFVLYLISVVLCLAIIACLCQRSARDHYHRNEVG